MQTSNKKALVVDPNQSLIDRYNAVETVLAMHRSRGELKLLLFLLFVVVDLYFEHQGTTPWWSSVSAGAATLTAEQPYSTGLLLLLLLLF
jgi:hypothetical protein